MEAFSDGVLAIIITIIAVQGNDDILKKAVGGDWKGKLSPLIYLAAIVAANYTPWASLALYAFAAMIWFVPDPRIAKMYHA